MFNSFLSSSFHLCCVILTSPHRLPQTSHPLRFWITRFLSLCTSPHLLFKKTSLQFSSVICHFFLCLLTLVVLSPPSLAHRWRMTGSMLPWWSIESSFGCLWPCASWEPWASSSSLSVASSHNFLPIRVQPHPVSPNPEQVTNSQLTNQKT